MRGPLERLLRRLWAGEAVVGAGRGLVVLLAPLSWLWRAVTAARNARFDRGGRVRVPGAVVVSVGNLAVGGTGKTPVAAWIADHYRSGGRRIAVILSGYARDEVLLHERWAPEAIVLADRDRVEAARAARRAGADVLVLDDGFQHRWLGRDLDVVLLAAELPFPGSVLPLGPYREPSSALARADFVIVTRRTASLDAARALADVVEAGAPGCPTAGARLAGGCWTDLAGAVCAPPAGDVLAVAGIGRPEVFADTVRGLVSGDVSLEAFADHHDFTRVDVERIVRRAAGRTLVTTEKDSVKLLAHAEVLAGALVLRQRVEWDWGERDLVAALDRAAAEHLP